MHALTLLPANERKARAEERLDKKLARRLAKRERQCLRAAHDQFARFFRRRSFFVERSARKTTARSRNAAVELVSLRPLPSAFQASDAPSGERYVATLQLAIYEWKDNDSPTPNRCEIAIFSRMPPNAEPDDDRIAQKKKALRQLKTVCFTFKTVYGDAECEATEFREVLRKFFEVDSDAAALPAASSNGGDAHE